MTTCDPPVITTSATRPPPRPPPRASPIRPRRNKKGRLIAGLWKLIATPYSLLPNPYSLVIHFLRGLVGRDAQRSKEAAIIRGDLEVPPRLDVAGRRRGSRTIGTHRRSDFRERRRLRSADEADNGFECH